MTVRARLPLPVTRDELTVALARETRPAIRRRLEAILAFLDPTRSRNARATYPSLDRWLRTIREEGLAQLLADYRGAHRLKPLSPESIRQARAEIAAALRRRPHWRLRLRLLAIDAFLSGQKLEDAAAIAHVKCRCLEVWMGRIRHQGIATVLARWEAPHKQRRLPLNADPELFRAAAAAERRPKVKRGLLALAYVADGVPVDDAAARAGINYHTVRARIRRFQAHGLDGVL